MLEKEEVVGEIPSKNETFFVVCAHGHSRSKMVARILGEAGYRKARAIGVDTMKQRFQDDRDLKNEFINSKFIICVSPEIESRVRANSQFGNKKIITLNLIESDHSISNRGSNDKRTELKIKIISQLTNLGMIS